MKTLDEMIAVMEASKTKKIEVRPLLNNLNDEWYLHVAYEHDNDFWNWAQYDYRVKPEVKEPQRLVGYRKPNESVTSAHPQEMNHGVYKYGYLGGSEKVEFIELTPEIREKIGIA